MLTDIPFSRSSVYVTKKTSSFSAFSLCHAGILITTTTAGTHKVGLVHRIPVLPQLHLHLPDGLSAHTHHPHLPATAALMAQVHTGPLTPAAHSTPMLIHTVNSSLSIAP